LARHPTGLAWTNPGTGRVLTQVQEDSIQRIIIESFVLRDFWVTEAALGVTMLSYNLMSVFRHAVMRQKVHHTLSTLHHQVLAVGALWDDSTRNNKQTFRLAVARKRRPWFDGLWANAGEPVKLTPVRSNS